MPWTIYMKHTSLRRFALAWSRQVTARIRSWWLNGTVTLWRIHAACSEFWLNGTVSLWRIHAACSEFWLLGCNHKSNTGSKDQKQKYTKERSHEDTHHGFDYNFQRRLWNSSGEREQGFIYTPAFSLSLWLSLSTTPSALSLSLIVTFYHSFCSLSLFDYHFLLPLLSLFDSIVTF
jgi:hypothetical protein